MECIHHREDFHILSYITTTAEHEVFKSTQFVVIPKLQSSHQIYLLLYEAFRFFHTLYVLARAQIEEFRFLLIQSF